jgi:hypothetical protein
MGQNLFFILLCSHVSALLYSETSIYRSRIRRSISMVPERILISTMAPACIGFSDPSFLFQTPDENGE